MKCDECNGSGQYELEGHGYGGTGTYRRAYVCSECGGSGEVADNEEGEDDDASPKHENATP